MLLLIVAAGAAILIARRRRRRAQARDDDRPADLGFMRAIHAGLRRDAARLQALAPQLERGDGGPGAVPKGWATFRQTLQVHHAAEDDDLWPVLRNHLTDAEDLHQLDLMVEEHRGLTAAIQAVDAALASSVGVTMAAQELSDVLGDHLDHEEQQVFPCSNGTCPEANGEGSCSPNDDGARLGSGPSSSPGSSTMPAMRTPPRCLTELPRPAHLVYRRLLRPRYEAQRRWQPA